MGPNAEDIEFNFTNHAPNERGVKLIEENRELAKQFAKHIAGNLPKSREASLAITKIEEALFYANAAAARYHNQEKKEQ